MERVHVRQTDEGLVVDLRHPHSPVWLAVAWIVTVWGLGALGGTALAVASNARPYIVILPFALGMLPMMFLPYSLFMAPWLSSGHETATLEGGLLILRSIALGIPGPARRFRLDHVQNLRFEPLPNLNRRAMHSIVMDPGSLAFDYGSRTVRFGRWFSGNEAKSAVVALNTALRARQPESPAPVGPEEEMIAGLPPARHRISEANGSMSVRIPYGNTPLNRRVLVIMLGGMFVSMLALGLLMSSVFSGDAFTGPLSGALTSAIVLVFVVPTLGTTLLPVERARLVDGVLEVGTSAMVLTMVPTRRYDIRYIHNLRGDSVIPGGDDLVTIWTKHFRGDYGQIAFGYGGEQHRFGQFVDAPEARQIAQALNDALARDPRAGSLAWEAYQAAQVAVGGE